MSELFLIPGSAVVSYPSVGAYRVHPVPDQLPARKRRGERSPYRYDDPDEPGTGAGTPFQVRYLASTLRGCLLEVLAQFRPPDDETARLLAAVDGAWDDAEHQDVARSGLAGYLRAVRVGTGQLLQSSRNGPVATVHDLALQAALDRHSRVRAVLDDANHVAAWGPGAHLDESKIRMDGPLGYAVTQACSRVLHDAEPQPAGLHYRSKHDDREDCWAIYGHADVTFTATPAAPLDPKEALHRRAVLDVAAHWHLHLPHEWSAAATKAS